MVRKTIMLLNIKFKGPNKKEFSFLWAMVLFLY